jgi:hypothetical protein
MASATTLPILLLALSLLAVPAMGQSSGLQCYGRFELPLVSGRTYAHPHRDVRVWCEFTSPTGSQHRHEGYWNGGSDYRVRFAPPEAGRWHYRTSCSDTMNAGLHGVTGEFDVQPYSGDDPFRKKGWLKVSDNKRYLTYGNGDPFFYLGDTVWEIVRKSLMSEARQYIADRKRKGFNALQLVTISCLNLFPNGAVNRYGEAVYLDTNFSMINPRYFDYMDSIVTLANDNGMIAAIVPMWAAMNEQSSFSYYHRKPIPDAETLLMERYVAARYGGHNVMWFAAADDYYDTPGRRNIWTQAARLLDSAGGGRHLLTIHPIGLNSSIDFFPDADWLDFHMYQSSHSVGNDYSWHGANRGYDVQPRVPILNGECVYEDIYNNVLDHYVPEYDNEVFRIRSEHIRQVDYETLFSGSYVGIAYGASGLWQWSRPEDMGNFWPRYSWDTAMAFPGSAQMGVFRTLMERYHWYNLIPGQSLITQQIVGRENYLPVAYNGSDSSRIFIYFPKFTNSAGINFQMLGKGMRLEWIHPVTGETQDTQVVINRGGLGPCTMASRDTSDWLLVATRVVVPDTVIENPNPQDTTKIPVDSTCAFHIYDPSPNPCIGTTTIRYAVPYEGTISLTWWDVRGRRIGHNAISVQKGEGEYRIEHLAPGAYQLHLIYTPAEGKREEWSGRIVSMQ